MPFRSRLLPLIVAVALAFGLTPDSSRAQPGGSGFVRLRGAEFVTGDGTPLMLRGTNLGNWLVPEGYMFKFNRAAAPWQIRQVVTELVGSEGANRFWQAWEDNFVTRDDLRYIRQTGMNLVRLPFDYRYFTPEQHPDIWLERGFELMDRVVEWSAEEGLYVMLDMHAAPCGQNGENIDNGVSWPHLYDDPACVARTAEVWRRIAEHYANDTTVMGYDLLNEPIPHFEGYADRWNAKLEPVYKEIATAIRQVDTNHVLILGGAQWDSNLDVFTDTEFDDKLAYTFHKYWTAPTVEVIQDYLDFREKHDVPLFMGESGENTHGWIDSFRQVLDLHDIAWTFWPYKRLDTDRSMRTYDLPPYWQEVIDYQKKFGASFEEKRKARPPQEHIEAALEGLLRNVRYENTREVRGYVRALGMRAE